MNKLFGLFLLALAFLPGGAEAANRFLTCNTTCTITAADTSIWGTSSGGTGASVPGSGDDVILDAGTCVGGTTCTATMGSGYNPTWNTFTMSACTASTSGCIFDANTNANTITLVSNTGYANTGAGTRTLSGGTWVLSGSAALWNTNSSATVTNAPNISYTSTSATGKQLVGGGKTYGTVTLATPVSTSEFTITNNNTIGTFTVAAPYRILFASSSNQTITTMSDITATSSTPVLFNSAGNANVTLTSANNFTCTWCGFSRFTFTGGGTFTGTNSLDFGSNSGITITPPSGGGGGGGRIIGG